MLLEIPTRIDSDNYVETVTLEGVAYTLSFAWNYRASCWSLSILDASGNEIVSGTAVRAGVDMLSHVKVESKPPGKLIAFDTSGNGGDPGLTDLGGRVVLYYKEST